ncbi:MAG: DUF4139 domain-containing protein [Bacteroidetes bacterium]|nr:DUF4139 domain-containing protein [Bacteroidota bacterium]
MKKIKIAFILVLSANVIFAQEVSKTVTSKISAVSVFLNGAEITHSASVTVGKGKTNLVFTNIASSIDSKSIRISSTSDVNVSAISYEKNYMAEKKADSKIDNLQDSLEIISAKLSEISYDKSVYNDEKTMIIKNNSIGGQNNGVSVLELQKAADFFRLRLKDINTQLIKLDNTHKYYNEKYAKINKQLNEMNSKTDMPEYSVVVTVSSNNPATTNIELKYLVNNAGWGPYYDIRTNDVNSPIKLDYKAKVFNNCGVDWNDVKLTLSTADPSASAQKPLMSPWNLTYNNQINEGYLNYRSTNYEVKADLGKKDEGKSNEQFVATEVSELSVDFEIKTPYTIPSNSKNYIVDIQTNELQASYAYFSVPKIDKDAFLVASITGWENLNLIEGPANIFYGGTYIGQSTIDTRFANDTLDLSLGRDKKVAITRTKKQDFSSKSLFGTNKKETYTYDISVRNNNKSAIEIEIQDQIPVSGESDIKVEVLETSKADYDAVSGSLKWNLKLAPSESKVFTISFTVQYPKSKTVNVRRSKKTYKNARFM